MRQPEKAHVTNEDRLDQLSADIARMSKKLRILEAFYMGSGYPNLLQGNAMRPYPAPIPPLYPPQQTQRSRAGGYYPQVEPWIDIWFDQFMDGYTGVGVYPHQNYTNCMAECRRNNCRNKSGAYYCGDWFHCNEDCHVTCSR